MSMINSPDRVPEVGDSVESLAYSFDGSVVDVVFVSGKVLTAHVDTRTPEEASEIPCSSSCSD